MSCIIHNIGAQVWIDTGIQIINETTKKASRTDKRIEGRIIKVDRVNHKVTVHIPELNESVIVDADKLKKK